jgi:hypothetical protein
MRPEQQPRFLVVSWAGFQAGANLRRRLSEATTDHYSTTPDHGVIFTDWNEDSIRSKRSEQYK